MVFNKFLLAVCFMGLFLAHTTPAQNSRKDFLVPHILARAKVGVGPIFWNKTVAAYARNYANQRSEDCALEHSGGPYDENIAMGFGYFHASQAVKLWVDEKPNYEYASNSCVADLCLHYTQVVWLNSIHIGCGRVQCKNGWMFITCNYDPPGNYVGERPF